jgi:hypothetical protein
MWVCCIDRVEFGCVAFACIAIAASACVAAGRAALTMFRVSTGDDWVYIMQQCGVRPPVCTVSVSLTLATWHHTSPLDTSCLLLPTMMSSCALSLTHAATCKHLTMLPTSLGYCILQRWGMSGWVRARMLSTL